MSLVQQKQKKSSRYNVMWINKTVRLIENKNVFLPEIPFKHVNMNKRMWTSLYELYQVVFKVFIQLSFVFFDMITCFVFH